MSLVGQHCDHAILMTRGCGGGAGGREEEGNLCRRFDAPSPASQVHSNVNSRDTRDYSPMSKIASVFCARGHGFEPHRGRRKARATAFLCGRECQVTTRLFLCNFTLSMKTDFLDCLKSVCELRLDILTYALTGDYHTKRGGQR
jgi:hypothetical protein